MYSSSLYLSLAYFFTFYFTSNFLFHSNHFLLYFHVYLLFSWLISVASSHLPSSSLRSLLSPHSLSPFSHSEHAGASHNVVCYIIKAGRSPGQRVTSKFLMFTSKFLEAVHVKSLEGYRSRSGNVARVFLWLQGWLLLMLQGICYLHVSLVMSKLYCNVFLCHWLS